MMRLKYLTSPCIILIFSERAFTSPLCMAAAYGALDIIKVSYTLVVYYICISEYRDIMAY